MTRRKPSEEILLLAKAASERRREAMGLPPPDEDSVSRHPETMIAAILEWLDWIHSTEVKAEADTEPPQPGAEWIRREIRDPQAGGALLEFWGKIERQGPDSAMLIKVKCEAAVMHLFLQAQLNESQFSDPTAREILVELVAQAHAAAGSDTIEAPVDPEAN